MHRLFSALLLTCVALASTVPAQRVLAYDHRVALLFGFAHYERGANKGMFRDFPIAENDLIAVAEALDTIGFEVFIYTDLRSSPVGSRFEFRPLASPTDDTSGSVGSQSLYKIIFDMLHAMEKRDGDNLLLVYYTGHGGNFGGTHRVLALPESQISNPHSFPVLKTMLNDMNEYAPSVDKLLVVDACADKLSEKASIVHTRSDEELPDFMYSSTLGEMSFFDPHRRISVFTQYFAAALLRGDELWISGPSGTIETQLIKDFVRKRVPLHPHEGVEQRKRTNASVPSKLVQHPIAGPRNIVLGRYRPNVQAVNPGSNATATQTEYYLRGIQDSYYRSSQ